MPSRQATLETTPASTRAHTNMAVEYVGLITNYSLIYNPMEKPAFPVDKFVLHVESG
jgi:hypothetical protein